MKNQKEEDITTELPVKVYEVEYQNGEVQLVVANNITGCIASFLNNDVCDYEIVCVSKLGDAVNALDYRGRLKS